MRGIYEVYIIDPETEDWWHLLPIISKNPESAKLKAFLRARDWENTPRITKDYEAYELLVSYVGSIPDKLSNSASMPDIIIGNS